jgi:hypothetical protein
MGSATCDWKDKLWRSKTLSVEASDWALGLAPEGRRAEVTAQAVDPQDALAGSKPLCGAIHGTLPVEGWRL